MHIIKIEFTNSLQLLVSANRRSISFLMHSGECQRQEKSCWICEFISPIINAQTFDTYFILCKRKSIFSGPSGEQYRVNRFYSRHLIVLASFLRKQVTGWRSISLNNKNCKPPWDDMWCVRYINTHSFIHSKSQMGWHSHPCSHHISGYNSFSWQLLLGWVTHHDEKMYFSSVSFSFSW